MKKPVDHYLMLVILVSSIFLAQQSVFAQSVQKPGGKCGDGICDEFEKAHPKLCPRDCGGQDSKNEDTPNFPPQMNAKCGDGICDEFEKSHPNICPKDCGGSGSAQPQMTPNKDKCGDGVCDEFEKAHPDLCPKDCQNGQSPVKDKTKDKTKACVREGEMCGGIAGFLCCPELTCKLAGNYPDASGICVKITPGKQPKNNN